MRAATVATSFVASSKEGATADRLPAQRPTIAGPFAGADCRAANRSTPNAAPKDARPPPRCLLLHFGPVAASAGAKQEHQPQDDE